MSKQQTVIDELFARLSRRAVADALGLSRQSMALWARVGYVPAKHAAAVERMSGIPRQRLCPRISWGE
jgi:DNA-binding transcriptional regulator YdaS (Cro superfamily)